MDDWRPIVDADGCKGMFRVSAADDSQVEVKLATGERMIVPKAYALEQRDGTFRFDHSFLRLLERSPQSEIVVPVVHEEVVVQKRPVEGERIKVSISVSSREQVVDVPLTKEELKIERVAIGRTVDHKEEPRQEGDTLIVPVYEEVLVVEKRLVLREELRVTAQRKNEQRSERFTLRREDASIERSGPGRGAR